MKLKIAILSVALFMTTLLLSARVTEQAMGILPTGQIMVELTMPDGKAYPFIYDANGNNLIRPEFSEKVAEWDPNSKKSNFNIKGFKIGEVLFSEPVHFSVSKKLNKRSDLVIPPNVMGTIGPKLFKGKAVQFNLRDKKIKVADSFEELNIAGDAIKIPFTVSITNAVPIVMVSTVKYGEQQLYIDPSKPFAFCFNWTIVEANVRNTSEGTLTNTAVSLNGEDTKVLMLDKSMEIMLDRNATANGFQPGFSDELAPAIGAQFLVHFKATIDYENLRLILEPNSDKGRQAFTQ